MPLSEDSRALLQLLLGRGKSYADISGLLGIEESEVRDRAVKALAEVDPSAPEPDQDLTDYLLGQADPITRADVGSRISSEPALAEQAENLTDQLRLLVPGADLPRPGSAAGGKPRAVAKPAAKPTVADTPSAKVEAEKKASGLSSITSHQRRLIALLLGGALLAVVVILLVTGVFGGGSSDDPETPEASPTVAVLEPVSGQQGSGQVQFGFAGSTLAANIQISDLQPSKKGEAYVLWLYGSTGAFPFYANPVDKSGSIGGQVTLNEAVICLVASDFFPSLRLSRVDNKEFNKVLRSSNVSDNEDVKLPKFTGETVLEGPISMPQQAKDTIVPICNGSAQQQGQGQ